MTLAEVLGASMADVLAGRTALVTGVERYDEGVRVFVGPRYNHRYFLAHPGDAEIIEAVWNRKPLGHIVIGLDHIGELFTDTPAGEQPTTTGDETSPPKKGRSDG